MEVQKHIIFFTTPAWGHVFCVLPVIRQLAACGYRVDCYASPSFQTLIERSGANYVEYAIEFEQLVLSEVTADFFELTKALLTLNRKAYLEYLPVVEESRPDLILYDSMCSFAKSIAYKTRMPSVCLVTTIGFNLPVFLFSNMFVTSIPLYLKHRSEFHALWRKEREFRSRQKLAPLDMLDLFMNLGEETIIFSPKEFQPFYRSFPKHVHFVGTTIRERKEMFHEADAQYPDYEYYVSLGSIFTENIEDMRSLLQDPYISAGPSLVVTGHSGHKDSQKGITFRERVNQIDLLPHCRYFINHGGINSVYESIYYGIPQLCLPQQEEQRYVSWIVQRRRLGLYMRKYDAGRIHAIREYKQHSRIEEFQRLLHEYDGTHLAADIIETVIQRAKGEKKHE